MEQVLLYKTNQNNLETYGYGSDRNHIKTRKEENKFK